MNKINLQVQPLINKGASILKDPPKVVVVALKSCSKQVQVKNYKMLKMTFWLCSKEKKRPEKKHEGKLKKKSGD